MAGKKSYKLRYDGAEYDLPTFEGENFERRLGQALAGEGVLRLQLNEGVYITLVVGGGVPISMHERPVMIPQVG